ncbi:MAG: GH25 family lysozyme [bacterium]
MKASKTNYIVVVLVFSILMFQSYDNKKAQSDTKSAKKTSIKNFWAGDTSSSIHGIDISHHQKMIDWKKVKETGVTFVFVKSTEGIDYLDTMFNFNWKTLAEENMIRGAYHFYVSDDDPKEQAKWFVDNVGSFENMLPPVIDVERAGHKRLTPEEYIDNLIICLEEVESLSGRKPLIYSSPGFANEYLIHESIGEYVLWIAEYGVDTPIIPEPWQKRGWEFWQYTEKFSLPGVPEPVDRNVYSGKYYQLLEMVD